MGDFKIVGWLVPSGTGKTFKVMYNWEELFDLIDRLKSQKLSKPYVFLGLVSRYQLHESIHSFPMKNVEIDQFTNAYSPNRRSPFEIVETPLADPEKLEENNF